MLTTLQFLFKATLFIAFYWVADAGQTMGVTTCFIVCHAEAHFGASKSCVASGAVFLAGRCLALAHHQLKEANWCWCFCDWQYCEKFPVLHPPMTLRWSKILHSFKSMTSNRMLGSLNVPDVEVDNRLWVEAFHCFAYSGRNEITQFICDACLFGGHL